MLPLQQRYCGRIDSILRPPVLTPSLNSPAAYYIQIMLVRGTGATGVKQ